MRKPVSLSLSHKTGSINRPTSHYPLNFQLIAKAHHEQQTALHAHTTHYNHHESRRIVYNPFFLWQFVKRYRISIHASQVRRGKTKFNDRFVTTLKRHFRTHRKHGRYVHLTNTGTNVQPHSLWNRTLATTATSKKQGLGDKAHRSLHFHDAFWLLQRISPLYLSFLIRKIPSKKNAQRRLYAHLLSINQQVHRVFQISSRPIPSLVQQLWQPVELFTSKSNLLKSYEMDQFNIQLPVQQSITTHRPINPRRANSTRSFPITNPKYRALSQPKTYTARNPKRPVLHTRHVVTPTH